MFFRQDFLCWATSSPSYWLCACTLWCCTPCGTPWVSSSSWPSSQSSTTGTWWWNQKRLAKEQEKSCQAGHLSHHHLCFILAPYPTHPLHQILHWCWCYNFQHFSSSEVKFQNIHFIFLNLFQIGSHILAYSNSCINPILYAFLSPPFLAGFRNLIPFVRIRQLRQASRREVQEELPLPQTGGSKETRKMASEDTDLQSMPSTNTIGLGAIWNRFCKLPSASDFS